MIGILAEKSHSSQRRLFKSRCNATSSLSLKDSDTLGVDISRVVSEVSETMTMFGNAKKIKLYDKLMAMRELNKMLGFYAAEEYKINNPDGNLTPQIIVTIPANGRESA